MAKSILKLTETQAVVKISGSGTETITMADLMSPTQVASGGAYSVGINFIQWTVGTSATIVRNSVTIFELFTNTGSFDLSGYGGCTDYTQADQPIAITITGGGTLLIILRKEAGFRSKIEPEYFGPYDNPTVAGS